MFLFLVAALVILGAVFFASRSIENSRKKSLRESGNEAVIHGEAAKSLQNNNFRIRKTNRDKGVIGELGVAEDLERLAVEYGLTVLHDLSIPGSKANIDHVLISPKVVYVIDSKNYTGIVKVSKGKDGVRRLRVGGRDQTALAEKLNTYAEKIQKVLLANNIEIKVLPLLAFYKATFHEDSQITINGVTVNVFGIENELLRYANLKAQPLETASVATALLKDFPPKI